MLTGRGPGKQWLGHGALHREEIDAGVAETGKCQVQILKTRPAAFSLPCNVICQVYDTTRKLAPETDRGDHPISDFHTSQM